MIWFIIDTLVPQIVSLTRIHVSEKFKVRGKECLVIFNNPRYNRDAM